MTPSLPKPKVVAVAFIWTLLVASILAAVIFEHRLNDAGRSDLLPEGGAASALFIFGLFAPACVGTRLALLHPRNPAGWLFMGLALALSLGGLLQDYGAWGTLHHPGSLPAARLAAVYADGSFLSWIVLLTFLVLVTPTGSAPSPRWRIAGWMSVASGLVYYSAIPFRSTPLDSPPFVGMTGPWSNVAITPIATPAAFGAMLLAHLALLGAVLSFLVRVRRARGEERRQLLWLLIPAIPFPFLVLGALLAARADNDALLMVTGLGYVVLLPIAAALAIEKQRLYDVDRLVSRAVAYTLLTALVVASYLAVAALTGLLVGKSSSNSATAAVAGTVAGLALAGLVRRRLQDAVDRRFSRRAFSAMERVRRFVAAPGAGVTIESVLAEAAGDPALRVAYWSDALEGWVSEAGWPHDLGGDRLAVPARDGRPGALVGFDATLAPPELVARLTKLAAPELENARLRAAISLQLEEVRDSRRRILSAQMEERKRIERDLHDGSQQRLLALAMNLRATELAGEPEAALKALPGAVDEIQATVRELRELANGLYPGALADGGLSAALQDFGARTPVPIELEVTDGRFPPHIESTAWFIASEAIANVVKHAHARSVSVVAQATAPGLVLTIEDDGTGGADPAGHGLRGLADRAEAVGGRLSVNPRLAGGTSITALLPCES